MVNTVVLRDDGTTWGDSTDGEGLVRSLVDAGLDVGGRRVLVVGAGGAARAVVLALGRAGAAVTVTAPATGGGRGGGEAGSGRERGGARSRRWARSSTWCSTPPRVGMAGEALPISAPGSGQWAVDLIYHPAETPFLATAAARGLGWWAGSACWSTRPRSGSRR